jgi:hypothetical protein
VVFWSFCAVGFLFFGEFRVKSVGEPSDCPSEEIIGSVASINMNVVPSPHETELACTPSRASTLTAFVADRGLPSP